MSEPRVVASETGWTHLLSDETDMTAFIAAAESFRSFLDHWSFVDQESGEVRVLGHSLWAAQEEFVRAANEHDWVFFLKARKLGETTIECAYDGWVLRFGVRNARVHLFSRRDDAAQELLAAVKFGLERLPRWMRLSIGRSTTHQYELLAGEDDRRLVKAYPADEDTAVESTCTHGHVDEWARMGNPKRVWQAIEATMAGTCHFVTTGLGPANWTSGYWRKCLSGDARHHPCFIGALNRPDRDPAWLQVKRRSMDETAFNHEYPTKWEDALSGGGEFVFQPDDVDAAGVDCRGLVPASPGRKYVKAWDIGRHADAAVGVCLDVTEEVQDVVAYSRLRGVKYPFIQLEIEEMHRRYPGLTVVEKNSAGEAVLENLNLPEHQIDGWNTSGPSKARIIAKLQVALQNQLLKWDPAACEQLDAEIRGYQIPDDSVVQDSVIALAIAHESSERALLGGRVGRILHVG